MKTQRHCYTILRSDFIQNLNLFQLQCLAKPKMQIVKLIKMKYDGMILNQLLIFGTVSCEYAKMWFMCAPICQIWLKYSHSRIWLDKNGHILELAEPQLKSTASLLELCNIVTNNKTALDLWLRWWSFIWFMSCHGLFESLVASECNAIQPDLLLCSRRSHGWHVQFLEWRGFLVWFRMILGINLFVLLYFHCY